jgi:hypothetical protein
MSNTSQGSWMSAMSRNSRYALMRSPADAPTDHVNRAPVQCVLDRYADLDTHVFISAYEVTR